MTNGVQSLRSRSLPCRFAGGGRRICALSRGFLLSYGGLRSHGEDHLGRGRGPDPIVLPEWLADYRADLERRRPGRDSNWRPSRATSAWAGASIGGPLGISSSRMGRHQAEKARGRRDIVIYDRRADLTRHNLRDRQAGGQGREGSRRLRPDRAAPVHRPRRHRGVRQPGPGPQLFTPGATACQIDSLNCGNITDRCAPIRCGPDRAFPQVTNSGHGSR
jgi:hypothetical protein